MHHWKRRAASSLTAEVFNRDKSRINLILYKHGPEPLPEKMYEVGCEVN
jgi:hypothetical protein